MLLARIQRDLYDFTKEENPDDFGPLMNFWYRANFPALSAALAAQPGLKLIADCSSIQSFEHLSKKLFLLADTIILRGLPLSGSNGGISEQLVPLSDYKPGYINDVIGELKNLRPSPMTLGPPTPYWTSEKKTLNSGIEAAYATQFGGGPPQDLASWLTGSGREHFEAARFVYAPFIPSVEMELEFMKNGVDLSAYFSTSPFFHQNYDWMTKENLNSLFSLKFPFLDGLDIETLAKIKDDHRGEFEAFSRVVLNSVQGVKTAMGTEEFSSEVRHIQRNMIDAGVSDVQKTFDKLESLSSLRKKGMFVGLLGLNAAALFGAPPLAIVSGLAASGVKLVMDKIDKLKEEGQLKSMNHYFLWRLKQETRC